MGALTSRLCRSGAGQQPDASAEVVSAGAATTTTTALSKEDIRAARVRKLAAAAAAPTVAAVATSTTRAAPDAAASGATADAADSKADAKADATADSTAGSAPAVTRKKSAATTSSGSSSKPKRATAQPRDTTSSSSASASASDAVLAAADATKRSLLAEAASATAAAASSAPAARPTAAAPAPVQPLSAVQRAELEHTVLCECLLVTLSAAEAASTGRVFLPGTAAELQAAAAAKGSPDALLRLDRDGLDSVLLERVQLLARDASGSSDSKAATPLTVLMGCWKRAADRLAVLNGTASVGATSAAAAAGRSLAQRHSSDIDFERDVVVALSRQCVSYTGLLLIDSAGVLLDYASRVRCLDEFERLLCADPSVARSFPPQFLHALITHYSGNSGSGSGDSKANTAGGSSELDELFNPCINALIKRAKSVRTLENYTRVCFAFAKIASYPPIANLITRHPDFLPHNLPLNNGRAVEVMTLLGPFFGVQPNARDEKFQHILRRTQQDVDASAAVVQQELYTYQSLLTSLFTSLLNADDHARARVLDWISRVLKTNASRKKLRYDRNATASDGFWINFCVVLVRLCAVFVPTAGPGGAGAANKPTELDVQALSAASSASSTSEVPAARIDPLYLFSDGRDGARMDYSNDTRVRATPIEVLSLRVALEGPDRAKLVSAGTVPLVTPAALAAQAAAASAAQSLASATTREAAGAATAAAAAAAADASSSAPATAASACASAADSKDAPAAPAAGAAAAPAGAAGAAAAGAGAAAAARPRAAAPSALPTYAFAPRRFNLSTELFFLTHDALSVGLVKSTWIYGQMMNELARAKHELDTLQASGEGHNRAYVEQQLQALDGLASETFAMRAHLSDPTNLHALQAFCNWSSLWLLRVIELSGAPAPTTTATDAVADDRSWAWRQLWCVLPESLIDNIIDFFLYLGRFHHAMLMSVSNSASASASAAHDRTQGLFALITSTMAGPTGLKNAALRAKMAEILALFLPDEFRTFREPVYPMPRVRPHPHHVFLTDRALNTKLVPSLLDLYCEIESGPNQYYEKFNTRHLLSQLLEFLWDCPPHQRTLVALANASVAAKANPATATAADAKSGDAKTAAAVTTAAAATGASAYGSGETFTRFVNFILNDTIFLLDESLKALVSIREEQLERRNEAKWRAQPPNVLRERDAGFVQREQMAIHFGRLAMTTVQTLHYLTTKIVGAFVSEEFVARVAGTVAYYLVRLNGPTVSELRVDDPAKYLFYPRVLCANMVGITVHLGVSDAFVEAFAADERSYKPDVLAKAVAVMRRKNIIATDLIARFEAVLARIATCAAARKDDDAALGADIPDHFLDAIMGTLMTDPVTLPAGKQNVDRATIRRHLLNTPKDPFTRQPLTLDMCTPNTALKAEIDAWVAQKRAERKANPPPATPAPAPATAPAAAAPAAAAAATSAPAPTASAAPAAAAGAALSPDVLAAALALMAGAAQQPKPKADDG